MFTNATIALLAALGFGGWVYSKIQRQTGGNTKSSLTVAGLSALVAFIVIITLLQIFFK